MIIKKLVLHNFGVYASTNTFEFEGKKPIVLIGGLNGRGKTTFLEAILLALYGANSFAYKESKYSTYGLYLKGFVNTSDETGECYVEITIAMSKKKTDRYTIKRSWNDKTARTHEKIMVYKGDDYSEYLSDNWQMYIENILPSALSNFFFFDGEKIAELAVDSTNKQLKESIRSMLGISSLDILKKDLYKNLQKYEKGSNDSIDKNFIDELREKKRVIEEELASLDNKIIENKNELDNTTSRIEELHIKYSAMGGNAIKQQQDLIQRKAELQEKIKTIKSKLYELSSNELPLYIVKDLLESINNKIKEEYHSKSLNNAIEEIDKLYDVYKEKNGQDAKSFITFLKNESKKNTKNTLYDVSDHAMYQLQNLTSNKLENDKISSLKLMEEMRKCQGMIDEIDNYLSVEINDNEIKNTYKKIRQAEEKRIELEIAIKEYENNRSGINGSFIKASSELNNAVGKALNDLETNDDISRKIKYSNYAINIINEYSLRLQRTKTEDLSDTITKCYKKLANKKNLIKKIIMDSDTLEISYINSKNQMVEKSSLSAGEKQLMVISILWALALCSKKKLPVIIDTPLSRLDSNHRKALVTTYFPKASDQTIILSTDSEIDAMYYDMMKENVGDEFTLQYDDESRRTNIAKGYLMGEKNDN